MNFLALVFFFSLPALHAEVYQGCDSPDSKYSRTIILDGTPGKTFEDFKPELRRGDHIILKGFHEKIYLNSRYNSDFAADGPWIFIEGENAKIGNIDLRGVKRIALKSLTVESDAKTLVFFSSKASQISITDSLIQGGDDSSSWDVSKWLSAPSGLKSDNANCVSILSNSFRNLRHGISVSTRAEISSESSVNALIKKNSLRNLSGDFIRPLGSNVSVIGNYAVDGYVSAEDGDLNHDDFIQGFAYPLGIEFSNVKVAWNFFQATTNLNRKFISDYQGISVFDGTYSNFAIRRNIVLGSAYHGITIMGGKNGIIENNTVMSINPDKKFRIYVARMKSKSDYAHSENIIVRNNIANILPVDKLNSGVSYENNEALLSSEGPDHFINFDMGSMKFNLRLLETSPYFGQNIGRFTDTEVVTPVAPVVPIYPGCEAPATSFKRVIVLDAAAGDYLNDFFYSGKAQPGDHIIVKGHQDSFITSKYSRPDLVSSPSWIKIESQGATFSKFDIRDLNRIQVSGLDVYQPQKGNVLNIASAKNIVITDSKFSSDPSISNYYGGRIDSSSCVSVTKSHFSGVRTGINVFTRADKASSDYHLKVILKGLAFSAIERSNIGVNAGSVIVED